MKNIKPRTGTAMLFHVSTLTISSKTAFSIYYFLDDQHLVRLKSDNYYINASLLKIPLTGQSYIFTQGPLESTTDDFWQMVWEQNSQIIVMLCTFAERGIPK